MSLVVCPSCGRHAFQHETSCPHCGQRGKPTLLALTAALGLLAACTPEAAMGVYGAAPIDPSARTQSSQSAVPLESSAAPTQLPSVQPSSPASAQPSGTPSATPSGTAAPNTTPTTAPTVKSPPVKVYGPPPRDPLQRKE